MQIDSTINKDFQSYIRKLAIGTAQFGLDYGISNRGGKTSTQEVNRILHFCESVGIEMLDTAYAYGDSEIVLGQHSLKNFNVVSKFLPSDNEIPNLKIQIAQSLKRLNLKSIYAILAHRSIDVIKNPEIWDYLQFIKENKIVKKIGFSFNDPSDINLIIENNFIPDVVQAPFNFFDNRFSKGLIYLKETFGTEIHTRSTFLQGLFFMDSQQLPDFFDSIKYDLTQLQRSCPSLPGSLLKYALNQSFIDKVVIGINSLDQLVLNIKNLDNAEILNANNIRAHADEILTPSKWPSQIRN